MFSRDINKKKNNRKTENPLNQSIDFFASKDTTIITLC